MPVTVKLVSSMEPGAFAQVKVLTGPDPEHLDDAGTLSLRFDAWQNLLASIHLGVEELGADEIVLVSEGEDQVARAQDERLKRFVWDEGSVYGTF